MNKVSKEQKIARNVLVEVYINQLLPVIKTGLRKHKKRKTLLKEMKVYQSKGKKLLKIAEELLVIEDTIYERIKSQINIANNNFATAENIIKKGMPMEDW